MLGMMDLPLAALMLLAALLILSAMVDCIRTPAEQVRYVPKLLWVLFLLHAPVIGGLVWLYLGKKPIPNKAKGPTSGVEPFAQAR
ncbi:PLD nuclease N-terminal domain-containing protein [Streptomyces sp. NPDC050263]|uniref:PLD nuclease N-terminal domain-containing protein n=1 Tax=Streptomyces sp. NPDC050263 TaxID=3155037 RepID=UPI0034483E0C